MVVYRKELEELVENTEKNLRKNATVNVGVNNTQKKIILIIKEDNKKCME